MAREHFSEDQISLINRILSYVCEEDASEITERIVSYFPGVLAVCESDFHRIATVTGDEGAAHLIRLVVGLYKKRITDTFKLKRKYSEEKIKELAAALLFGCTKETVAAITFNDKGQLLSFEPISQGSANSSGVTPRMLLDIADKRGASSVIVVHNHLNGDADPSEEDVKFTLQMRRILASAGIKLITHYVVAGFIVTEVGRSESQ